MPKLAICPLTIIFLELLKGVFCDGEDTQTDKQTDGHCDSMTESASVENKITKLQVCYIFNIQTKIKDKLVRAVVNRYLWSGVNPPLPQGGVPD